jgi:hypothetical protein
VFGTEWYEQALPIWREVGDRAGEATTLNNMAMMYYSTGQQQRAVEMLFEVVSIARAVGSPAMEAGTLNNIAAVLVNMGQPEEAITFKAQAIAVMEAVGLTHEASGAPLTRLKRELAQMRVEVQPASSSSATLPVETLQAMAGNTIGVMTKGTEQHEAWRQQIEAALQDAQEQGSDWMIEVELFTAVLAILDGQTSALPADHPYAAVIAAILAGIAEAGAG